MEAGTSVWLKDLIGQDSWITANVISRVSVIELLNYCYIKLYYIYNIHAILYIIPTYIYITIYI